MSGGVMKGIVAALMRRLLTAECQQACDGRNAPVSIALQEFSSSSWASATFEGHRHRFVVRVAGEEDGVDGMARRLEGEFERDEGWGSDLILAHIDRTETQKTIDGDGRATSCLTFEALTILS